MFLAATWLFTLLLAGGLDKAVLLRKSAGRLLVSVAVTRAHLVNLSLNCSFVTFWFVAAGFLA